MRLESFQVAAQADVPTSLHVDHLYPDRGPSLSAAVGEN